VEEFEQQVHCRMTDDNSISNNNSDWGEREREKEEKKKCCFLTD
jgi:hypothetical protein